MDAKTSCQKVVQKPRKLASLTIDPPQLYHAPHTFQAKARTMIYLLNTPILTAYGLWCFEGPLNLEAARALLYGQTPTSAIGHHATALLLRELLERDIPTQRIAVNLQPGDSALVFRLTQRLPEGRVLSLDELRELPHEFGWLHYHSPSMNTCQ